MTEEIIKFPCEFPIKVIVKDADGMEAKILTIFKPQVPDFDPSAIQKRPSKNKKYTAFTVTITAESQEQLDILYQALNDLDGVVMTL